MKKYTMLVLLVILAIFATGCGSGDKKTTDKPKDNKQVKTIKVSSMSPEDHPHTIMLREFVDHVEKETGGTLKLDVYPANQLGDYTSVYEEVMKGTIEMALISVPSQIDSKTEVLNMPYLVENYEHAKTVYSDESYIYQLVDGVMQGQGIKLLGLLPMGFGGIGSTEAISNYDVPGEDKGLMVRVPQMNVYRNFAEKMGFRTVSIPYADVYTALQTGTADGVIGAPASDNYTSFRDVIKYYYQYNNTFEALGLMINQNFWNELTDNERDIITEAGVDFTINGIDEAEKIDKEYLAKLKEEGIEVHEFTPEEITAFAKYIRETVWPLAEDALSKEVVENLLKEVQ